VAACGFSCIYYTGSERGFAYLSGFYSLPSSGPLTLESPVDEPDELRVRQVPSPSLTALLPADANPGAVLIIPGVEQSAGCSVPASLSDKGSDSFPKDPVLTLLEILTLEKELGGEDVEDVKVVLHGVLL
jgi:hypothetical protein